MTTEWYCVTCEADLPHISEYIKEQSNPYRAALLKFTCKKCGSTDFTDPGEYFDVHTCRGSGNWCYCDDTMHQHCTQCDNKCNYNRDYEC